MRLKMKKVLLFLLVWLLPVGLFAQQGDNNKQKALVFTHVTVIDATGAPAKDEYGGTPLHWAAVLGRVEIAGRLINAGANVNAKDKNGYTPLDATTHEQFSGSRPRLEVVELLREKGGKGRDIQNNQ